MYNDMCSDINISEMSSDANLNIVFLSDMRWDATIKIISDVSSDFNISRIYVQWYKFWH